MKFLSGILAAVLCIGVFGCGVADTADLTPGTTMVVSQWTVDQTSCQPITRDNIKTLSQLVQIGKGEPTGAAWSPDGEKVALSTGTGVHLFDGHTLKPLGILLSGYTRMMAWSQDGALLALSVSVAAGEEIQVWDIAAMEKKYSISQKRTISALCIDQENNTLLALGQQQSGKTSYNSPLYKAYLDTYSLKNGKKKEDSVSYKEKEEGLMSLYLSLNGPTVFGAGRTEMFLWNAKGKLIYSAPITYPMYALSVSGTDVSVILDLASSKKLQLVDRASKTKKSDVTLPKGVTRMEWNDVTQELTLYNQTGYLLFSLATQEITADVTFSTKYAGTVWLSGDKSRLVQIDNGTFRLVDLATGTLLSEQSGFDDRAWQVAVSGNRLAAAKGAAWSQNSRLMLWDLETLTSVAVIGAPNFSETLEDIFFLPDETELFTYAFEDRQLKVWNTLDGSKNRDIELTNSIYCANLSKDGTMLALGYSGAVGVAPLADTSSVSEFYLYSYMKSLSLSDNGSRIAACDGELLIVWDAVSKTEVLNIYDDTLKAAAISPDGELVAALYRVEEGYLVKMMNVGTGKTVWKHSLPDNYQYMSFTPDGSMLAVSAYEDGLIFLNAETGKTAHTLAYDVSDFEFSKDGRFVITASSDGTVRLWGVVPE